MINPSKSNQYVGLRIRILNWADLLPNRGNRLHWLTVIKNGRCGCMVVYKRNTEYWLANLQSQHIKIGSRAMRAWSWTRRLSRKKKQRSSNRQGRKEEKKISSIKPDSNDTPVSEPRQRNLPSTRSYICPYMFIHCPFMFIHYHTNYV